MMRRVILGICVTLCLATAASTPANGQEGRWKVDGDGNCYFDANDEGPNQCSAGRWKVDSEGGCTFDAADSGPDQCQPQG